MRKLATLLICLWCSVAQGQAIFFGQNASFISGQVATPTFSPVAGTYTGSQTVTISSSTSLAVICYTTDGSTPTESLNLCSGGTTQTYSTPITVSVAQTVKALGTKATLADSNVGSAAYGFITPIACAENEQTSGSGTLTVTYSPTAGNNLVFGLLGYDVSLTSVALSGGGTVTIDEKNLEPDEANARISMGHYANVPSGTTSVVFTIPSGQEAAVVCEYSGGTGALDIIDTVGLGNAGTSGNWTTNSINNGNANDIVFAMVAQSIGGSCAGPPFTITSPYTAPSNSLACQVNNGSMLMGYNLVSSKTGQIASGTNQYVTGGSRVVVSLIGAYQ